MYKSILVALDGSECSRAGADLALSLAAAGRAELVAFHAYGADLHRDRFREMEAFLPSPYQDAAKLTGLRTAHESLIVDGFDALSRGFVQSFLAAAAARGVTALEEVVRGRNYVELLAAAGRRGVDCVVLGAHGLGDIGDGALGSTASRVLRRATCDVLVARPAPGLAGGPILAGVDGSPEAMAMLERAAGLARALARPLVLGAAYDPGFHKEVFRAMARSLPEAVQDQVGLAKQEGLHDDIIDAGLRELYGGFLEVAAARALAHGVAATKALLTGKAYAALGQHAAATGSACVTVGRLGRHREPGVDLGSTPEALAWSCPTSVLVTATEGPVAGPREGEQSPGAVAARPTPGTGTVPAAGSLEWEPEALVLLGRVPAFVRPMARRGVERLVRSEGGGKVTAARFAEIARRLGMGAGRASPGRREDCQ